MGLESLVKQTTMSYPPASWKVCVANLITLVLDKIMWLSNLGAANLQMLGQRQVFRCD